MAIFTDNFNRANGAIGSNWTNISATMQVQGNKAASLTVDGSGHAVACYSAAAVTENHYSQVVMGDLDNTAGVCVRAATGAFTCYLVLADVSGSTLYKIVAGSFTTLGSAVGFTLNDVMRLEAAGTSLKLFKNNALILTVSDATLTSGRPGIAAGINNPGVFVNCNVDNFEGSDEPFFIPLAIPFAANKTRISIIDTVGESVSPFSLRSQQYDWQADRLAVEMSFPLMRRTKAAVMMAFVASLRGKAGSFLAGDPMSPTPLGVATGTPLVNGAQSQRATTLVTKGWTASQTGILKAGTWMQIGAGSRQRMYMVLADSNSDGSGNATFNIYPRLRDPLLDGQVITISNCKALFRLSSNQRQWDIEVFLAANFTLSGVEAI